MAYAVASTSVSPKSGVRRPVGHLAQLLAHDLDDALVRAHRILAAVEQRHQDRAVRLGLVAEGVETPEAGPSLDERYDVVVPAPRRAASSAEPLSLVSRITTYMGGGACVGGRPKGTHALRPGTFGGRQRAKADAGLGLCGPERRSRLPSEVSGARRRKAVLFGRDRPSGAGSGAGTLPAKATFDPDRPSTDALGEAARASCRAALSRPGG